MLNVTRLFLLRFETRQKCPFYRRCYGVPFRRGVLEGKGQIAVPGLLKLVPIITLQGLVPEAHAVRNDFESLEAFGELVLGNGFAALAVFGPRSALRRDQASPGPAP